jgi:cytidine deaminase
MTMDKKALISEALAAREFAYTPYSHFNVGAALLTAKGKVYRGCNIESATYTPTNCAERTAIFKAVSEGERDFCAIAIVGGPAGKAPVDYCFPCGVCRQVMTEFCKKDFVLIIAKSEDDYKEYTLDEILPHAFSEEDLRK